MKHFRNFMLFLLMVILVVISVVNRQTVAVDLWPLPLVGEMPLFVVFFFGIFVGLILSALFLAVRSTRHSFEMRKAKKQTTKLESDVETLERELDKKPPKVEQKDYSEEGPGEVRKIAAKDGQE